MKQLPVYSTDYKRQKHFPQFDSPDTFYENKFEGVVQVASRICNMPISLLTLIEFNKQWYKSGTGTNLSESVKEISFYANTINEDNHEPFEIKDIAKDIRFKGSSLFKQNPSIRYCAGAPLYDNEGNRIGTLCVADFKPNHLNEEQIFALKVLSNQVLSVIELNTYNQQLKEQNTALKQEAEMNKLMLSIIAHDVRNPLGAIKGVMDFILTNEVTGDDKERLTRMFAEQLDTTIDLLGNLVEWSKTYMYKNPDAAEKYNLRAITENVMEQFKLNSILKNDKIVNLVDNDLVLMQDVNMIRFILRNLLANAIKFTKNGTVTVYAHQENGKVELTVSDTGVGMNTNQLSGLFQHMKHQSTMGTNNEKGNGLGLMLTKNFIDTLGGTIRMESEVGKGTTVYLTIPV